MTLRDPHINPQAGDVVTPNVGKKAAKPRTVVKRDGTGNIWYSTGGKERICWISTWQEWCRKNCKPVAKTKRIYLASSWRNADQPKVLARLRSEGFDVYDFRNPPHGRGGFAWSDIDIAWKSWSAEDYRAALGSRIAKDGFSSDKTAMDWADTCVLLLPSGRSAHLEAGYMAGQGTRVIVLTRDGEEPELMALLLSGICVSVDELCTLLKT